jgi:hypothetical protein
VNIGLLSGYGIYLKPEYAGLAMAFSSVSVVLNSLSAETDLKETLTALAGTCRWGLSVFY